MVFELPETYYVPAQGVVSYVYFQVPTNFKEDRWVQAAEALPGDRVGRPPHHRVRHRHRQRRPARAASGRGRCTSRATPPAMRPRSSPKARPSGFPPARRSCSRYTIRPSAACSTDRSKVGLIFAKQKPTREAFTMGIANPDLLVPAHADNVEVRASYELPRDARLVSLFPHMHLRGKDFKFTITKPGEAPQVVLSVPAYDFGWQTYYVLAEPMTLPKGTRVDCLAHFDNSENNPYNPDPNKLVRWGEQTFEEMMIGYLDMDVPVGTPVITGNDFAPSIEKATFATIRALRRMIGGKDADFQPRGRPR